MEDELKYLALLIEQQKINYTKEVQERIERVNDAIERFIFPQA